MIRIGEPTDGSLRTERGPGAYGLELTLASHCAIESKAVVQTYTLMLKEQAGSKTLGREGLCRSSLKPTRQIGGESKSLLHQ